MDNKVADMQKLVAERKKLDDLLNEIPPVKASAALRKRVHDVPFLFPDQSEFVFLSARGLMAHAAVFALLAVIGFWAGAGPLGGAVNADRLFDAAIADTVLGSAYD